MVRLLNEFIYKNHLRTNTFLSTALLVVHETENEIVYFVSPKTVISSIRNDFVDLIGNNLISF